MLNGGAWEYGTYSLYGTEILLWTIIVLFSIKKLSDKNFRVTLLKNRLLHYFIASLLALSVLAIFSVDSKISFYHLFHFIDGVLAAWVVYSLGKEVGSGYLFASFWLGGVVQGGFAVWQFLAQYAPGSKWLGLAMHKATDLGASVIEFGDERWLRAYGSFGSPNSLGLYLAVVLVAGLTLICHPRATAKRRGPAEAVTNGDPGRPMDNLDFRFRENDRIKRIVLTAGQLIILTGLLFSFSRGAWVAVAAGILATGILLLINRDKKNLLRLGKQTFFSLLLIAMALIIFKSVFFARFNAQNRLEAMSLNERKSQAREAINFFWTKPLTGVGAGAYTLAAYQQNPNLPTWRYQPVHNIYFLTLAELGVVGFIIVSLFHCFIVR